MPVKICQYLVLLAVTAALILSSNAEVSEVRGTVVGVHDGDSITLLVGGKNQIKVRLEGIDAPELKQDFGTAAKKTLSDMVYGKKVRLVKTGKDHYGRTLGNVYVGDTWVNLAMVERGMAWHFKRYSKDASLGGAEKQAQKTRTGIWSQSRAMPPWEWRQQK